MSSTFSVFGYAGLIWKLDIESSDSKVGYIRGFKRRMWQGSEEHRGTPNQRGRCATLVPTGNHEDKVWGIMYEVEEKVGDTEQRKKLDNREVTLGGYDTTIVEFFPRDTDSETHQVLVYIARDTNRLFWKEENLDKIADDIIQARGFAGPNIDYVTKLVDFLTNNIPEEDDQELFELDKKLRELHVKQIV